MRFSEEAYAKSKSYSVAPKTVFSSVLERPSMGAKAISGEGCAEYRQDLDDRRFKAGGLYRAERPRL
jgi:hypothetical protein